LIPIVRYANDPMVQTSFLARIADLEVGRGRYGEAKKRIGEALTISRELNLRFATGLCLLVRAASEIGLRMFNAVGATLDELDHLGVPRDAYDAIVTSGDLAQDMLRSHPGQGVFHLGPERDRPIFEGVDVSLVAAEAAQIVVNTGLFDDTTETPDDYRELLSGLAARRVEMVCANPDIVVERGDRLIWCAGALARDYALLGGHTLIAGKPHRPIYEAALDAARQTLGRDVAHEDVLAIGDGIMTDAKGAADNAIDLLYVTAGIHAAEYGEGERPDPSQLAAFLEKHGYAPVAAMPRLR
jgi:HAD superfamily hydrolase (TIGR01459 family)